MNDDQKNAIKQAFAKIVKGPKDEHDCILALLALGVVTPNEFRLSVGLEPLPANGAA